MTEIPRRAFVIVMMSSEGDSENTPQFGSAIVSSRLGEFAERLSIFGRFILWLRFMEAAHHGFRGACKAAAHKELYK